MLNYKGFENQPNSAIIYYMVSGGYILLHYVVNEGQYKIHHKKPNQVFLAYITDMEEQVVSIPPLRMANTGNLFLFAFTYFLYN